MIRRLLQLGGFTQNRRRPASKIASKTYFSKKYEIFLKKLAFGITGILYFTYIDS
jgi:hypothetical protein